MEKPIKSKFHDIAIHLTGWDEPNNGRMLHVADIIINGRIENETYFQNWNRLDERLNKYIMDSPDKKHVFIPEEGGGFIIDTTTLRKIQLPYKGISTVTFVGNYFFNHLLVLVHVDEIILFNLTTHVFNRIEFSRGFIIESGINEKEELLITYSEKVTRAKLTEIINLSEMEIMKKID